MCRTEANLDKVRKT